jgi:transposase-like protein
MSYQMTTPPPSTNGTPPKQATSESVPKAKRRSFSAEYKRRILREADRCSQYGQIGAMLRREGLYSSHLTDWRKRAAAGQLADSKGKRRGRQAKQSVEQKENARLRRENERLKKQLKQAELIIEAQKKVAELLDLVSQRPQGQS